MILTVDHKDKNQATNLLNKFDGFPMEIIEADT